MHSAIYEGRVRHRRFTPRNHQFSYSATLFYLDLDELPQLFDGLRGWSVNGRNFGCFRRADYMGEPHTPLIDAVRMEVVRQLGTCPLGPVRMLTNLRILGICFNPVTFYYCFEPGAARPSVVVAQVTNTPWNERHCYVLPCNPRTGKVRTSFDKQFHVSPFNPMDMVYRWVSTAPGDSLLVHMENYRMDICHMDATLMLTRQDWTAKALQRLLWRQPWQTLKVPLAIYWQALKLLIKRVPLYNHQWASQPQNLTTVLQPSAERSSQ